MTKVHEQAELIAGGRQVIEHLRAVFVHECGRRFQLNNDLIETDEVGDIDLLQRQSLVIESKRFL